MNHTIHTPVFILSCERSGSTMLRYILDTHSKVTCPSHLYLGNLCESLNRMLTGTLAQTQIGLDEAAKKQFAVSETAKIIRSFMDRYVEAKNKQLWCEKTPMNLDYLAQLDVHFPDARYICLYRQCMDVVRSSINLSKYRFLPEHVPYVHRNPENIIAAMAENWLDKTGRLLEFEATHQERCFRLKYESVVMQPEATLAPLFRFLGLEWEDDLMERVFETAHDSGEGDGRAALSSRIRQDSVGNGTDVPRAGIPSKFTAQIDGLLGKLGYPCLDDYYAKNTGTNRDAADNNDIAGIVERRFAKAVTQNRRRYPRLKGLWNIIVTSDADRIWLIDLSGEDGLIKKGECNADTTLRFSAALLVDLANGTRDAAEAFAQGEIEIEGVDDAASLMDLGRLLFS